MSADDIEGMKKSAKEKIDSLTTKEQVERVIEFLMRLDPRDLTPD